MCIELRADFFNLFNRSNFNEPSGVFGTPTFGQVTSARAARTIQHLNRRTEGASNRTTSR